MTLDELTYSFTLKWLPCFVIFIYLFIYLFPYFGLLATSDKKFSCQRLNVD